jgi:hypothetical protein
MRSWLCALVAGAALSVLAAWPGEARAQRFFMSTGGYHPSYYSYGYGMTPYYGVTRYSPYYGSYTYSYSPSYRGYGYTPYYTGFSYRYPGGVTLYSSPYYGTGVGYTVGPVGVTYGPGPRWVGGWWR